MTFIPPGLSDALWRIVPAPLRSKLRSTLVKRFVRFAPAAVCAVGATQITYIVCLGPLGLTAGISGFLGWLAGAAVSYVISRWAWERKGKPHLFKETLPFVAVSIGAGIILTLASKLGNHVAVSMGLDDTARGVLVADVFYFGANCLTFALRFVIFHYVLFADRGSAADVLAVVEGREPLPAEEPAAGQPGAADPARFSPHASPGAVTGPRAVHGDGGGNGRPSQPNGDQARLNGDQARSNGDQARLNGDQHPVRRPGAERSALPARVAATDRRAGQQHSAGAGPRGP
jgi:putative flippase GtrA